MDKQKSTENATGTFDLKLAELINEHLSSDATLNRIKQQIDKGLEESLRDLFTWNGKAKTLIKEKLESVMIPAIEEFDFSKYTVKLDTVLTDIVNTTKLQDNIDILDNFKSLMVEFKDNTISIQEIFEKYCELVSKKVDTTHLEVIVEDVAYYEDVTCEFSFEKTGSSWFSDRTLGKLHFKCYEDESLNFTFDVISCGSFDKADEWRLYNIAGTTDVHSLRYLDKFKMLILQLMRNYTHIHIDTYELEESVEVFDTPEATFI